MNWAVRGHVDPNPDPALRRVAAGVLLSLAAHILLLAAWRGGGSEQVTPPPARPLAVRLQPLPPPVVAPAPPAAAPTEGPRRRARAAAPRGVIAVAPNEQTPAAPEAFVVDQASETPPDATPRFDMEGARAMARSLTHIRDPAREGTAIGQFPEKPLETETRAARAIGAAKRRNCKDGIPGGLLAPLVLLADKKDSGCKW